MDWNRRHCARRGHVLYEPTEAELRDRLRAETALGTAWRCLRCGDFVLDEPAGRGPAADAPEVPRGKALRSLLILRLLAIERVFRFLLVGAAAIAVWKFSDSQKSLSELFEQDLTLFRPIATHYGYDLDNSPVVATIQKAFNYKHSTLDIVAVLLGAYAVVELIEAVGLWLAKRWGEYFAVVATAAFIPIEVDELLGHPTWFKWGTLALNILAVVYLLLSKRLFGLRGGKKAAEREHHGASLLEVEAAAHAKQVGAATPEEAAAASTESAATAAAETVPEPAADAGAGADVGASIGTRTGTGTDSRAGTDINGADVAQVAGAGEADGAVSGT